MLHRWKVIQLALVIRGLFYPRFLFFGNIPNFTIRCVSLPYWQLMEKSCVKEEMSKEFFLAYSAPSLFAVSVLEVIWQNRELRGKPVLSISIEWRVLFLADRIMKCHVYIRDWFYSIFSDTISFNMDESQMWKTRGLVHFSHYEQTSLYAVFLFSTETYPPTDSHPSSF